MKLSKANNKEILKSIIEGAQERLKILEREEKDFAFWSALFFSDETPDVLDKAKVERDEKIKIVDLQAENAKLKTQNDKLWSEAKKRAKRNYELAQECVALKHQSFSVAADLKKWRSLGIEKGEIADAFIAAINDFYRDQRPFGFINTGVALDSLLARLNRVSNYAFKT